MGKRYHIGGGGHVICTSKRTGFVRSRKYVLRSEQFGATPEAERCLTCNAAFKASNVRAAESYAQRERERIAAEPIMARVMRERYGEPN